MKFSLQLTLGHAAVDGLCPLAHCLLYSNGLPASVTEVAPRFNWSSETGNKSTSADKGVPRTGKPGENQKREASDKQRKWLLPASKGEKHVKTSST